MKRDSRVTFEFYIELCKLKKQPVDRKEFARWKKELDKVLSWLDEMGTDPIQWLTFNASAFSGRGYQDWWVPLMKLKVRSDALRVREFEWEKQKRQEMKRPKKRTGIQRVGDFVHLAVEPLLSKNVSGSTLGKKPSKPPTARGAATRSAYNPADGGEL